MDEWPDLERRKRELERLRREIQAHPNPSAEMWRALNEELRAIAEAEAELDTDMDSAILLRQLERLDNNVDAMRQQLARQSVQIERLEATVATMQQQVDPTWPRWSYVAVVLAVLVVLVPLVWIAVRVS